MARWHTALIASGILLASAAPGWAQPANDTCPGAVPITGGFPFAHTTADVSLAGSDATDSSCQFTLTVHNGMWYSYTAATPGLLNIQLSITGQAVQPQSAIAVHTGACGGLTPVSCGSITPSGR